MIVDVHAHMDMLKGDLSPIIKRAKKAGLNTIISNSVNLESCKKNIEISKQYPIVKPALAIYPRDAVENPDEIETTFEFIKRNVKKAIAIGEAGLDYHLPFLTEIKAVKIQKQVFQELIKLAEKSKLPLIVHSRKAEKEVVEILETSKLKHIILHCYGGKLKLAKRITENGWNFSIPASIVRSEHFQKIVEQTPLPQLLSETDAPFQSPFHNKQNEPAFIIEGIKKIAEIKSITLEDCKNNLFMNFQRIFK
ncbi:TatD family hydrolase [Candidatus Woesearchaeota archaeon]|nr:TatD family hydrolase [Candidatus Woesearchaeota archaeon]